MRVRLCNMKTEGFNGQLGELVVCDKPRRVGVRLKDDRRISVRLECIERGEDAPTCAICLEPMDCTTLRRTSCDHEFHWWCLKEWRAAGGADVDSANMRCPQCRRYQGPVKLNKAWYDHAAQEVVAMALGFICQDYAARKGQPEPTMAEEALFVTESIRRCQENGQADYVHLQRELDAYRFASVDERAGVVARMQDVLLFTLIEHVFTDPGVDDLYGESVYAWMRSAINLW